MSSNRSLGGYLAKTSNDGESVQDRESSVEFIDDSKDESRDDIRGTDAFLKDPAISEMDDDFSDARSAVNMEPEHNIYGNRFEKHDPKSRGSFYNVSAMAQNSLA